MKLEGKRVLVVGMGVSGAAARDVLVAAGAVVVTLDANGSADVESIAQVDLGTIDLAIASPGVPPHSEPLTALAAAGVDIWSEVELAWQLRAESTPWVLVTGTNGKTTTVQMLASMASAAGLRYGLVGNVGEPVTRVASEPLDLLIVEISSFQLHFTRSVSPLASICLNVDDDHLDWHDGAENYRAAKAKVYAHTRVACVYPAQDRGIEDMVREADVVEGCRAVGITLGIPEVSQLGVVSGVLADRAFVAARSKNAVEIAEIADLDHLAAGAVPPYLAMNALAAAALARAAGIEPEHVRAGLVNFRLDAHRTAKVAVIGEVTYVDDSKATNTHAARAAFGGFTDASVVWIAGGLAKGADYAPLVRDIAPLLRAVVIIGAERTALAAVVAQHASTIPVVEIEQTDNVMAHAVNAAQSLAKAGDTVLLSPASASMDQFRNYADRGDAFARAVEALER